MFALGIEVEAAAAALFFLGYTVLSYYSQLRLQLKTRRRLGGVVEFISGSVWLILFAPGLSPMVGRGGGFYLLAIVIPFMFGWNVDVSWSLITEVAD